MEKVVVYIHESKDRATIKDICELGRIRRGVKEGSQEWQWTIVLTALIAAVWFIILTTSNSFGIWEGILLVLSLWLLLLKPIMILFTKIVCDYLLYKIRGKQIIFLLKEDVFEIKYVWNNKSMVYSYNEETIYETINMIFMDGIPILKSELEDGGLLIRKIIMERGKYIYYQ